MMVTIKQYGYPSTATVSARSLQDGMATKDKGFENKIMGEKQDDFGIGETANTLGSPTFSGNTQSLDSGLQKESILGQTVSARNVILDSAVGNRTTENESSGLEKESSYGATVEDDKLIGGHVISITNGNVSIVSEASDVANRKTGKDHIFDSGEQLASFSAESVATKRQNSGPLLSQKTIIGSDILHKVSNTVEDTVDAVVLSFNRQGNHTTQVGGQGCGHALRDVLQRGDDALQRGEEVSQATRLSDVKLQQHTSISNLTGKEPRIIGKGFTNVSVEENHVLRSTLQSKMGQPATLTNHNLQQVLHRKVPPGGVKNIGYYSTKKKNKEKYYNTKIEKSSIQDWL